MTTVEQSTDVAVPVHTAYDQWTRFEDFPRFMEGVQRIDQVTPIRTHWVTRIAGVDREFDAEISEQRPDERIAWHSVDGPAQSGVVTFHRLDSTRTRVMLQMQFSPEGFTEQAGDKLGLIRSRVRGDLENFRKFVEEQRAEGAEPRGWRGEVPAPPQASPPTAVPGPAPLGTPPTPPMTTPPDGYSDTDPLSGRMRADTPFTPFDPDESRRPNSGA